MKCIYQETIALLTHTVVTRLSENNDTPILTYSVYPGADGALWSFVAEPYP
jgi:hypothetical protein